MQAPGDVDLPGLIGQGDDRREIAQLALIPIRLVPIAERGHGLFERGPGAGAVAHQGQAGADLGAGERGVVVLHMDVVPPAQAGQIAPAGLGQDVEGVGGGAAAHPFGRLLGLGVVAIPPLRILQAIGHAGPALRSADLAHGLQGAVHGRLRHRRATQLCFPEEVGRIGAQPGVRLTVADPPETEGPVERLAIQQAADRIVQRRRGRALLRIGRQLAGEQQGIGHRHHLFGAAVRIARQGHGDGTGVEAAERRVADLQANIARRHAGQQLRLWREGLARPLQLNRGAGRRAPAQTGLDRIVLAGREAGTEHGEADLADARPGRGVERDAFSDTLPQRELEQPLEGHHHTAGGAGLGGVAAGRALDIVELQRGERPVARRQEARQVEVGDHRLPHRHRLRRRADGLVGPGHGHDPQFAIELGGRQLDLRLAVDAGLDHAGPQGHGLDRGDGQPLAAQLVSAEVDVGRGAQVRIEQATVVVTVVEGQRPLAEVPFHRIGRVELGQAQDALVHRRDGDPCPLADAQAMHCHRHLHGRPRIELHRRSEVDRQLAALGVERHIHQPERTARLGRHGRIARLDHADQHIGPATPGGVGLQGHRPAVGPNREGLELDDPVGRNSHLGLTGVGRLDGQGDAVALGVNAVAGADAHEVGRLGVLGGRAPAGGETDNTLGAARSLDHHTVVAPAQPAVDPRGPAGADVQGALLDDHVAAGPAPLPAAVLLEPVVVPVLGDQAVGGAWRGDARALGVDGDKVQAHRRGVVAAGVALLDLHAEIEGLGADLEEQALAHRPAARLKHRGGDGGLQRRRGLADLGRAERQDGLAVAVGDRRAELEKLLVEGRLLVAPLIVLERREGVGIGHDPGLALGLQTRAGRAIEEAGEDRDLACLAGGHRRGLTSVRADRQPLGREVLDREAHLPGGRLDALDFQGRLPAAARGALGQADVSRHRARRRAVEGHAFELHARGAADDQHALAILDGARLQVADQGREVNCLAGPIDAAVGIEEAVDFAVGDTAARFVGGVRGVAAAHALFRQINRRPAEVEHGQVSLGAVGHDHLGMHGAVALEQRPQEADPAGTVGAGVGQRLAVLGHKGYPRAGHDLGRFQRPHDHVEGLGPVVGDHGHVGEDDPAAGLGGLGALALLVLVVSGGGLGRGVSRLDHIAARLHVLEHRAQGEDRGDALSGPAPHGDVALPDHPAFVIGAVVAIVAGPVALARGVGRADRGAHQIAVRHAPDLDGQAGDVDRFDAHAVGVLARQDHTVASEADIGRLFPEGEVDVGVVGQRLATGARQALEQGHPALGQAKTADAQLRLVLLVDADSRRAAEIRRDQNEVGIGLPRVQRFGHLDTGQRLGVAGVQPGLPDRETVRPGNAAPGRAGRARLAKHRPQGGLFSLAGRHRSGGRALAAEGAGEHASCHQTAAEPGRQGDGRDGPHRQMPGRPDRTPGGRTLQREGFMAVRRRVSGGLVGRFVRRRHGSPSRALRVVW